ncbi:MAG: hypothetical protein HY062_17715 [Bacteroidetes bacterium]|nr:hypothetical protein [Bacteroidota bacterium]
MKKSIALVALAFGVTGAFAQDLTSKKGEPFLPEAGDYAIGVDASPFLQYVGNFFGKNTTNGSPNWNYATNNFAITGKKFKDANTAYRATVNIGFSNNGGKSKVLDRSVSTAAVYPALPTMVENKYKTSSTTIGLAVGIEKRRGKTRLQGVYGAEAGLGINTSGAKYTYGNSLNPTGTPAVVVDPSSNGDAMNGGANITTDTYGNQARVTKVKNGLGFTFGVRAFVGAEYFVAPKISIGGEFGWGLGFGINGKSKTSIESIGGAPASVGTQEKEGSKSSNFILGTDNKSSFFGPTGTIRLNLHF